MQLNRRRSARHDLPERWMCEITPRNVRIFPAVSVASFCVEKPAGVKSAGLPGGRTVIFPPDMVGKAYRLRSREKGDRYNGRKLKDMFERRGLDPYLRDRAVIIESSCGIEWVEHLKNLPEKEVELRLS